MENFNKKLNKKTSRVWQVNYKTKLKMVMKGEEKAAEFIGYSKLL